jgi:hypothetical protein
VIRHTDNGLKLYNIKKINLAVTGNAAGYKSKFVSGEACRPCSADRVRGGASGYAKEMQAESQGRIHEGPMGGEDHFCYWP